MPDPQQDQPALVGKPIAGRQLQHSIHWTLYSSSPTIPPNPHIPCDLSSSLRHRLRLYTAEQEVIDKSPTPSREPSLQALGPGAEPWVPPLPALVALAGNQATLL